MVCTQQRGRHGAVLGLRQLALGYGSPRLERYNGSSALEIVGEAASGVSTGTAMAEMEKLVSQLPTGFGTEWTAMSIRNGCPARRRRRCTPSRCWWCSCARRRCMKLVDPFSVMLVVPLG